MTYSQIVKEINKANLTAAELSNLNGFVIDTIKAKRRMEAALIKQQLQPGMAVMVDHPSHKSSTFTVESIKRTKALLVDPKGRRLNAPLSMLIPM